MADFNLNLSDVGQSLVALEAELKANFAHQEYLEQQIRETQRKNRLLQETAQALLKNSLPLILIRNGDFKP